MRSNSRYIKQKDDKLIKDASGFRCAWDGEYLFERHHLEEFSNEGSNDSDNLILLCPNCHTKYHKGEISKAELIQRRKELSGKCERSSGNLSVNKVLDFVLGGTRFIKAENIITYNDTVLLKICIENNYLMISLRLFNKSGNLICVMDKNKWWVENSSEIDFEFKKCSFNLYDTKNEIAIELSIEPERIVLKGQIFIKGIPFIFDENRHVFGQNQNILIQAGSISGYKSAYVFQDIDFITQINSNGAILFKI